MKYITMITNGGLSAIAAAVQAGTKVAITHMAIGDGGGAEYAPAPDQTALKGERWRGEIKSYLRTDNQFTVSASMPASTEAFTIRELALYTADGICFAVSNVPSIPHVPEQDGLSMEFDAVIPFIVDNADSVQITVNPHGTIAQDMIGKPGGVAGLDGEGHVPKDQLPPLDFDPAGAAQGVRNELNGHIGNRANPHGVTKAQVGLDRADNTPDAEKHVNYANVAGSANALNGVPAASFSIMTIGTYVGNDVGEQVINLGFTPKVVIVSDKFGGFDDNFNRGGGMTTHLSQYDPSDRLCRMQIISNGFKVFKGDRINTSSGHLTPHNYIAFR